MKGNVQNVTKNSFLQSIFSIFHGKQTAMQEPDHSSEQSASHESGTTEAVVKEIDELWNMVRIEAEDGSVNISPECREAIMNSFRKLRERFSDEELEKAYAWSRYVKLSVYCCDEPISDLIDYLNSDNYIRLTKRISDLYKSVCKREDTKIISNVERFAETVYRHILDCFNPEDVPSFLFLGRLAQNRGEFGKAREWYLKITETKEPFNGITSVMACYDEETSGLLSGIGKNDKNDERIREKVRLLNDSRCEFYDKWCSIMEEKISSGESVSEKYKANYVALITNYARFERNRRNYNKAYELLNRIPEGYPDMFRMYTEEGMLYQFRSYKNRFYDIEKAIESFIKAYDFIESDNCTSPDKKSRKSVLIPLANTYFQSGRYEEASIVCDRVLKIDDNESRAISLKKKIARIA